MYRGVLPLISSFRGALNLVTEVDAFEVASVHAKTTPNKSSPD